MSTSLHDVSLPLYSVGECIIQPFYDNSASYSFNIFFNIIICCTVYNKSVRVCSCGFFYPFACLRTICCCLYPWAWLVLSAVTSPYQYTGTSTLFLYSFGIVIINHSFTTIINLCLFRAADERMMTWKV